MTQPACPECEKLHAIHEQSQKCGEFIEWLQQTKGIWFAKPHEHTDECYDKGFAMCGLRKDELSVVALDTQKTLAEFFEIDMKKVEEERRALLEYLGRPK